MKEKSFYYRVDLRQANILSEALQILDIPHTIELLPSDQLVISFTDLPIRQYAVVRELLGEDGLPYPPQ